MLKDVSFAVLFNNKALFMRLGFSVRRSRRTFLNAFQQLQQQQKDFYRLLPGPNDSQDPRWKPVNPHIKSLFPRWPVYSETVF